MAKVMVVCPSCQQALEASDEDVGRDAQCFKCRGIFPIVASGGAAAEAPAGWLAGSRRYEYSDSGALAGVIGAGVCLIILVSTSLVSWTPPDSYAHGVIGLSRLVILILSAVCSAYMAGTLMLRASFVPSIATLSGWGMAVLMWQLGTWHMVHFIAKGPEGAMPLPPAMTAKVLTGTFFLAMLGSVLVVASTLFFYRQYHESGATRPIGGWLMGMQGLGFAAGVAAIFLYVRPELLAAAAG
jgi:hypothetical protein